eukprot:scaffold160148_cov31-Tisochrysis_lutea.AAC.4
MTRAASGGPRPTQSPRHRARTRRAGRRDELQYARPARRAELASRAHRGCTPHATSRQKKASKAQCPHSHAAPPAASTTARTPSPLPTQAHGRQSGSGAQAPGGPQASRAWRRA